MRLGETRDLLSIHSRLDLSLRPISSPEEEGEGGTTAQLPKGLPSLLPPQLPRATSHPMAIRQGRLATLEMHNAQAAMRRIQT